MLNITKTKKIKIVKYVFQKNYTLFFNNFFIREPIFIIYDNNMREKICNKTCIVFPPHLICNASDKSD